MADIKMPGLKNFAKKLKATEKKIVSGKKVFHAEGVVLYERWVKKNFDAQGKNHKIGSFKWKKLSKMTLEIRRTRKKSPNTSKNILMDNGQLKQRWFRRISDKDGRFTSGQNYSSLHEHGGWSYLNGRKFRVPQRKIFPNKTQGQEIIRPAFKRYVKNSFRFK